MVPSVEFLRNAGKASVIIGIIMLSIAFLTEWFSK